MTDNGDVLTVSSPPEFEAWLAEHHDTSPGVWLRLRKKGRVTSGESVLDYAGALDIALCQGWIDGRKRALDDEFWLQRFTPRRPSSRWSRVNRDKAEALIAAGRMRPAGLREVERARADGRWDAAYAGSRTATVPDDLAAALRANPVAEAFFATLDRANRFAVLYRVQDAKRPETRARRIEQFVAMLAEHRTLH